MAGRLLVSRDVPRGERNYLHLEVQYERFLLGHFDLLLPLGLHLLLLLGEERGQAGVQRHHGVVIEVLLVAQVLLRGLCSQNTPIRALVTHWLPAIFSAESPILPSVLQHFD